MKQRELALKTARYIIFETLEVLLIPVTAGLSLLGHGGALYLFTMSQETAVYQEIQPGPEEWSTLIFIGLFLLVWNFIFYLWRRRAGLGRLIGQCVATGFCAVSGCLWTALAITAVSTAEGSFFIVIPSISAAFSILSLTLTLMPLRALIRWRREQRALTKSQYCGNSQEQ